MRILVLSPYPAFPVLNGGAMRTFHVCRFLAAKGHRVTLLHADVLRLRHLFGSRNRGSCRRTPEGVEIRTFREFVKPEIFLNPRLLVRLAAMFTMRRYDLIVLEFPFQAMMVVPLARLFRIPYIMDEHNVEALRFEDLGRPAVARFIRLVEGLAIGNAQSVLTVSEVDRGRIRRIFSRESHLIPNGVDTQRFCPHSGFMEFRRSLGLVDHYVVLFFGNLRYTPNREAVRIINEKIAPEVWRGDRRTVFLIVGVDPPLLDYGPNIRVLGPLERIESVICASDLVIVPLLRGGGTRIKILESMACARMILSTEVGVEGLELSDSAGVMVASIERFARIIVSRSRMRQREERNMRARKASMRYDWDRVLDKIPISAHPKARMK